MAASGEDSEMECSISSEQDLPKKKSSIEYTYKNLGFTDINEFKDVRRMSALICINKSGWDAVRT